MSMTDSVGKYFMGAVAFNTYDFVKSLEDAGMDEKHAAAISAGILRAHEVADLATKTDVRELKADVKASEAALRSEMREMQIQIDAKIDNLELRIDKKLTEMRGESILVRWMLGLIMAGIAGLVIKSFFGT